jgi:hypothetical protein
MKTKGEMARELLIELFAHRSRITIADAVDRGAESGISRRTLQRACVDLGVREIHNGPYGAFWERS